MIATITAHLSQRFIRITLMLLLALTPLHAFSAQQLLPLPANTAGLATEKVHLCISSQLVTLQESDLLGFVIGVPNNSLRFRLQSVYPALSFRLFDSGQGQIRISIPEASSTGRLLVWWCSPEQAAAHENNGAQVLTLSEPIRASDDISGQALDEYFQGDAQLITLRPQELEMINSIGTLRVGVPDDSAPILSRARNGDIRGFDADMLALLAGRLNLPITWHDCGGWQACIEALESRDIDALTFITPTPERLQFTAFTVPYFSVDWALMSLQQRPVRAPDFASIGDATIAIVDSYSIFADAMEREQLNVLPVATPEEGISAVLDGRADAYLDSLPLLMNRVREQALSGTVVHILRALPGDQVSIGVRDDWNALVPLFDRAILATDESVLAEIQERWFEPKLFMEGLNREAVRKWSIRALIAVVIVLAAFWAWLAHLRRDIQRREMREAEMRHKAYHDKLTGLPNRMHIIEKTEQALLLHEENNRKCALLFINLDGFKAVNDEQGHDAGDELLIAVSQRIQRAVRKTDTVARYGGDEFVILLTQLNDTEQAKAVAEKILRRISMPFRLAIGEANIGASIGVAMYPDHGRHYEQLLAAADDAMYAVKEAGKHGVIVAKKAPA